MEQISTGKKVILGMQHVLAMFGATVLVPMLTGLNPGIAILAAGIQSRLSYVRFWLHASNLCLKSPIW